MCLDKQLVRRVLSCFVGSVFIVCTDKQYIPTCLEVTRGNSSVNIVAVGYELDDLDLNPSRGKKFLSSLKRRDSIKDPPSVLFSRYRVLFSGV